MVNNQFDVSNLLCDLRVMSLTEDQLYIIKRHEAVENKIAKFQQMLCYMTLLVILVFSKQLGSRLATIYLVSVFIYMWFCIIYYLTSKSRLMKKLKRSSR